MAESNKSPLLTRGLLDTSVVIDLDHLNLTALPQEMAVSSITLAELSAGPHATQDSAERARRQDRLQRVETTFDPLPFDSRAAQAYGRVYAAVVATGRKPRSRVADLMIASIAAVNRLPLYTRNPDDFQGLDDIIRVIAV